MELRLESRTIKGAIDQATQLLQHRRVVICMGDRLALMCLCLTEPIRTVVIGAATTEDEGFDLVRGEWEGIRVSCQRCSCLLLVPREHVRVWVPSPHVQVRITVVGMKDAKACMEIRKGLDARG